MITLSLFSAFIAVFGAVTFYTAFINYDKSEVFIFLFFLISFSFTYTGVFLGLAFILLKLLADELSPEFERTGFQEAVFNYNQKIVDLLARYGIIYEL